MYSKAFEIAFEKTILFEGLYSNDPHDAGGETMYGITIETARAYGYQGEMKDLTLEIAKEIYYKNYWQPLNLDQIIILSLDIACELFDCAVNCGVKTAGKLFQKALNILNINQKLYSDLELDGMLGNKTMTAFNRLLDRKDLWALWRAVIGLRFKIYYDIVEKNPEQEIFLRSWLRRI